MAKIDIYHYGSATNVRSVTLSNCDSASIDDYVVIIDQKDKPVTGIFKPNSVSGSTLTLVSTAAEAESELTDNCLTITVIQQGA